MANIRSFLIFCLLVLPLGVSAQPVSQVETRVFNF